MSNHKTSPHREFKRAAERALRRLEREGVCVNFDQLLEAMSAAAGYPDWNTASAGLLAGRAAPGQSESEVEPVHPRHPRVSNGPEEASGGWEALVKPGFLPMLGCDWAAECAALLRGLDVLISVPGGGKTIVMARSSLAWCAHAIERNPAGLPPRMLCLGAWPGHKPVAQLVEQATRPSQRHLVSAGKPCLEGADRINPFDTLPGCRRPTTLATSALVALLVVCQGGQSAYESQRLEAAARGLIAHVYSALDGTHGIRAYQPGVVAGVDRGLDTWNMSAPATWWECADIMADLGYSEQARQAQCQAVPTLRDLLDLPRGPLAGLLTPDELALAGLLEKSVGGEPMLGGPTRWLANPRIHCPHLLDYVETGSHRGKRLDRAALAYLLVRQASIGLVIPDPEEHMVPTMHRHSARMMWGNREGPARLVIDDVTLFTRLPVMGRLIADDIARARAAGVSCSLAGQTDIIDDPALAEVIVDADSVRCCGLGSTQVVAGLARMLWLGSTFVQAVLNTGPGVHMGGRVVTMVVTRLLSDKTNAIRDQSLQSMQTSPALMWALSTTAPDMALREVAYARMGPLEALSRLASIYPQGSAHREAMRRMHELGALGDDVPDKGVYFDRVVEAMYLDLYTRAAQAQAPRT